MPSEFICQDILGLYDVLSFCSTNCKTRTRAGAEFVEKARWDWSDVDRIGNVCSVDGVRERGKKKKTDNKGKLKRTAGQASNHHGYAPSTRSQSRGSTPSAA